MKIGKGTVIHPKATIEEGVVIGNNCTIHAGAVIGSSGSVVGRDRKGVLQTNAKYNARKGGVVIGDNVEIGSNTCIHKGTKTNTVIATGVFIGAMCNIGHDVRIETDCMILNMVCLCGWVTVGAHAKISPASAVIERTRIGSGSHVGIGSLVLKNVPDKTVVYGRPAKPRVKNKKKSANKQAVPAKTAAPVNKRTGVAAGKNKFVRRRKYGYRT